MVTTRRIVAVLAAALAALCAAVIAVGLRLSAPHPTSVGSPPPSLPGAETVVLPSHAGATRGWFVPGDGPGALLLLHGVWEDRRRMIPRAAALHRHGYSVLLIDLQAHGESDGTRITFGKLEAQDAAAAVDWLRTRRPGQRIGAIGTSLGGAATLLGPQPLPIDALVLESVYPDIGAALGHRLRAALGPLAGPVAEPLLVPLFEILLPPLLGVSPGELRPIDQIAGAHPPVLIASGDADDRTPLAEARALFDHAPSPKQFWAVPGATHEDLERANPDRYWSVVMPFLDHALRP